MKQNRKAYRLARPFFKRTLKDSTVRIFYEEEHAKTEIPLAIRSARLKAGLTQIQLAKKIGTTESVIARLESGVSNRIPSLQLLARIAGACGASFEFGFNFQDLATIRLNTV